jgi:acyl dehydratase
VEASTIVTDEVRSWIGREVGPIELPEAIASSDVRRFIDATGDHNPLWEHPAAARDAGYAQCPVPPMLILEMYRRTAGSEGAGDGNLWQGLPLPASFTNARNAGNEVEWLAPVFVGDRLTVRHRLMDVVARQGRAGIGIYVTRESEFLRPNSEVAVRLRATTVRLQERDSGGVR